MRSKPKEKYLAVMVKAAIFFLCSHQLAYAEEVKEKEDDAADLGSVVVISKKAEKEYVGDAKVETAPSSRATLSKYQLEKFAGIGTVYDSLKFLPGVNSTGGNSYGAGGAAFTVRGFNGGQIGIVRDGLPLNDPLFQSAVGSVIGDPEDYESIELVYGSSALSLPTVTASGGSIILTTVAPTEKAGVLFKQSFGNYDVQKSYSRVNFGEHNGFSGWISVSNSRYDNWRGKTPRAETNRAGANLQYKWNENKINLIVSTQELENYSTLALTKRQYETLPYGTSYASGVYPTYSGRNGVVDNPAVAQSQLVNTTSFHVQNYMFNSFFKLADNLDLKIDPYFQRIRGGTSSSGPFKLNEVLLSTDLNGDGDVIDTGVPFARQMLPVQYRPGVTAKLDWQITPSNKLQLGAWYEYIHSRQTFSYVPIGENGKAVTRNGETKIARDANGNPIYLSDQRTNMPTYKVWAEDTWDVTDVLTAKAGVAYHTTKVEAHNIGEVLKAGAIDYGNPGYKKEETYQRFLPAFSLNYKYDDLTQLYYSASSNLRIPAAASLYTAANTSQKPETTINQEIGWRYHDHQVSASAALFYDKFDNRQVSYTTPTNITAYYNAGKVDTKGVEFALNGLLPRSFNYAASYSYVLAEQQEDYVVEGGNGTGPAALPTKGKQLFNTPKHLAMLGFGYDNGQLYADLRGYYKGSIYGDLTNKESIPGVTTFNLALGYRLNNFSTLVKNAVLSINVNNLFDKQYLQGVSGGTWSSAASDGRLSGTPTYVVGEPRTVIGSLQFNF